MDDDDDNSDEDIWNTFKRGGSLYTAIKSSILDVIDKTILKALSHC